MDQPFQKKRDRRVDQPKVATDLQESEERFRQLAENIDAVFWIREMPENRVSYVSSAYQRLWGLEPQEIYENQHIWVQRIHPEDRDRVEQAFQEKAAIGQFDQEYRIVLPDGRIRWVHDRCFPLHNSTGEIYRFTGIAEDITDRQESEVALRRSEERYRTLFESMEDGFCVIQMIFDRHQRPIDYRFLEINPAFERQTGLQQAVGKTARELVPNLEEHWFEIYGQVALTGEPIRFENGSDKMQRWFEVYAFQIEQPENRKVALLFKDISTRKQAEQEREKLLTQERIARAEAERANRIKDEFLAILSHELRSPLNPILGWTKLLQTRNFDAAKTAEALAIIERNVKLQTQLVDDLLDVAKILRSKLSMNFEAVNLKWILESAIDTVRASALAKSITLHPVLTDIGRVSGDATRLQQIIWNLLSNAIKFTPKAGHVEIRLECIDNQACIVVSDTGKGISPEFLPYIFESFYQEDISITRKYGGLGLGLAIVQHLVEAHNGTITVESPGEGLGATFTVRLPLLNLEPVPDQRMALSAQEPNLAGIRVLTVDDDPDSRQLVTVLLTEYGAEVITVASAAEVFQVLESFQPDILISDISMPDMDGYTLLQQVRSHPSGLTSQLPAIALTAYAGEIDRQRAFKVGFERHMTKPIDPNQLAQAVYALVGVN